MIPRTRFAGLLILICTAGVLLRLFAYVQRPSLWIDEAMLGLNIILRSPAQLIRPLDFEQVAPIGFLMLERLQVALFGPGELALRALPMLSGCAVVILFPLLFFRTIDRAALLPATLLVAFSPLLVRYANELKPYSTDALVALAITAWTLARVRARQRLPLVELAAIGCLAIAVSIPSVFVLVPAGVYAAYMTARARERAAFMGAALVGLVWLAELLALRHYVYAADAATNAYLAKFWAGAFYFARSDLSLADKLNLTAQELMQPLFGISDAVSIGITALGAIVLAAGVAHYIKRQPFEGLIVIGPIVFVLIAFVARQYVFSGRTLLFLAPGLALLAGQGIAWISEIGRGRLRIVVLAALAIPLVLHQVTVLRKSRPASDPGHSGHTRAAIGLVLEQAEPQEPIYVFALTMPLWIYYTTNWDAPDTDRINWWLAAAAAAGPNSGNGPPLRAVPGGPFSSRPYRGSWEIAGSSTGQQRLAGVTQPKADLGDWARRDLARLRDHARPTAWLVFSQEPRSFRAFLTEARSQGAEIQWEDANLFAARIRFSR